MNKYEPEMTEIGASKKSEPKPPVAPSMPLPSLRDTADCFTQWFTPFLTNEQRAQTRAALNVFVKPGGLGERLQQKLTQFHEDKTHKSWLDDYWTNRFLARRDPIAINDNFFFLFRPAQINRTKHAASLIAAALNYKLVLDQDQIPLAVERTTPICTRQINRLFATTRIPGEQLDRLKTHSAKSDGKNADSRHIVVFCRGNIFQLELISEDGQPHTLADIERGLEQIIDHSLEEQPDSRSIGHLTTLPRSDWARTRVALAGASPINAIHLKLIESALFSVHLEDREPGDNLEACDQLLQGNSGNRWFDKSLQFIIFANGYAGLNVEHASLDRAAIIDFLDYILGIDPDSIDQYSGATPQGIPQIKELAFDLPPAFQKKISRAAALFEKLKQDVVTTSFEFTDFDMDLLAQVNVSPDAFVQCALQLAHWRSTQRFAAVGQNISMRHYTAGRVQCMWLLSTEMIDFVATMIDDNKYESDKFTAFQIAAEQHERRTLECRKGDHPEMHMEELLNIYTRNPEDFGNDFLSRFTSKKGLSQQDIKAALTLFSSPGWTCMHQDAFNTSFLASPTIVHHGFRTPDPGNIAIGFQVQNKALHGYLCAALEQKERILGFGEIWQQALGDLQTLIRENIAVPDIDVEDED